MIQYFCIQEQGKIIESYQHQQARTANIEDTLKKVKEEPIQLKTMHCKYNLPMIAFYFKQGSFFFVLMTQQKKVIEYVTQKAVRIQKYMNTIVELFYQEYDERYFKQVLKYAVVSQAQIQEEINKVEAGGHIDEINMSDQNEQLITKIIQQRYQLKQPSRRSSIFTRANKIITVLFLIIVALGWFYLANR